MDVDVKFKEIRDKLQETNKLLEDQRASTIDIFKNLESSGDTISYLNKELDNEREK